MHFETKAIHAGARPDPGTGAVAPPIHLSTTFERATDGTTPLGYSYIRDSNPTQTQLEEALAVIDSGGGAYAFASGMAAASALLQTVPRGGHVLLPDDSYYGVRAIGTDFFAHWGLTYHLVAMNDLDLVRRACTPQTKIIWAETPS